MSSKTVDSLITVLWRLEESARRTGRTTWLASEARKTGATMVCHDYGWARRLQEEYGVNAISLDTYLKSDYHRGRKKTQYLFDSPAENEIIQMKLKEAEKLLSGKVLDYEN